MCVGYVTIDLLRLSRSELIVKHSYQSSLGFLDRSMNCLLFFFRRRIILHLALVILPTKRNMGGGGNETSSGNCLNKVCIIPMHGSIIVEIGFRRAWFPARHISKRNALWWKQTIHKRIVYRAWACLKCCGGIWTVNMKRLYSVLRETRYRATFGAAGMEEFQKPRQICSMCCRSRFNIVQIESNEIDAVGYFASRFFSPPRYSLRLATHQLFFRGPDFLNFYRVPFSVPYRFIIDSSAALTWDRLGILSRKRERGGTAL